MSDLPIFAAPHDAATWCALFIGLSLAVAGPRLLGIGASERFDRLFVGVCALGAAGLSAIYIDAYLRSGPRIIDATSYYLEARGFAGGHLAWPVADPPSSQVGRFIVYRHGSAGVLFPPGYPAVLAIGFWLGAPMFVGPVLGALLVLATSRLASYACPDELGPAERRVVVRTSALLSMLCAALRYHTADTMSHGLAALLAVVCVVSAYALREQLNDAHRTRVIVRGLSLGLSGGWLVATRPATALGVAVVVLVMLAPRAVRAAREAGWLRVVIPSGAVALGAVPGLALLGLHQQALTGSPLTSTQQAYYANADGPTACFSYGWGARIGCMEEHGDFVRHNLAEGYGALETLMTTGRRLKHHGLDALNSEAGLVLIVLGFWLAVRSGRGGARAIALGALAPIVAYAPFYFDGNYPGGGARLLAEALPFEHVLAAIALGWLSMRSARWLGAALAVVPVGFALRAAPHHEQLRDRDGGAPLYDAEIVAGQLARERTTRGILFAGSDQAFNLGFVPGGSADGLVVLRDRGFGLNWLAWDAHGRPPAHRLVPAEAEPGSTLAGALFRWSAINDPSVLTLEVEGMLPAVDQRAGWASLDFAGGCVSGGRWVALRSDRSLLAARGSAIASVGETSFTVALPNGVRRGSIAPRIGWIGPHPPPSALRIDILHSTDSMAHHSWVVEPKDALSHVRAAEGASTPRCWRLDPVRLDHLPDGEWTLRATANDTEGDAEVWRMDAILLDFSEPDGG